MLFVQLSADGAEEQHVVSVGWKQTDVTRESHLILLDAEQNLFKTKIVFEILWWFIINWYVLLC